MSVNLHAVNDPHQAHERLFRMLSVVGGPLTEDSRQAIRHHVTGTVKTYRTREDIIREGDAADTTAIVVSGMVCRCKLVADGGRQITSFCIPGDAPDVTSLFSRKMDHSIVTLDGAEILHIPHANMNALFKQAPQVQRLFWHWTNIESAIFREWIVNVGRRSAYSRIAHLLCETVTRLKAVGLSDGETCDLPLTQGDLADATGLSSVHVNRSLQSLRKDDLISFRSGSLTVLNWPGLLEAGGFDPAYLHIAADDDTTAFAAPATLM